MYKPLEIMFKYIFLYLSIETVAIYHRRRPKRGTDRRPRMTPASGLWVACWARTDALRMDPCVRWLAQTVIPAAAGRDHENGVYNMVEKENCRKSDAYHVYIKDH